MSGDYESRKLTEKNTYVLSRIPLGYWSVPITSNDTNFNTSVSPYIPGAWPYLLQALNWAKNNSLHVILDLHGAPGSQNGFDNSGQRTNSPLWGSTNSSVERTLDIIRFIGKTIGGMVDVVELLNEPAGWVQAVDTAIGPYWQQGYQVVREVVGNETIVMIGDAFLGVDVGGCQACAIFGFDLRVQRRIGRISL